MDKLRYENARLENINCLLWVSPHPGHHTLLSKHAVPVAAKAQILQSWVSS